MDFISNIWKATTKGKDEVKPLEPETPQEATDEEIKEPVTVEKQGDGSDSSSTSGPDSDGPMTPETPNPDLAKTERSASGASMSAPLENVSHKAMESARSFGSFLYSVANKAGKTVQETAKQIKTTVEENSILADFNREQDSFLKSKQKTETGILPWVGCEDEENAKQQILSLSADKRNFVRSPPSGVQFEFDMDTISPVAMAMLQEDPNLEKMRFEIVPKLIPEQDFWRNYFYRVSLIKQSTQLSALGRDKASSSSADSSSTQPSPSEESNKEQTSQKSEEQGPASPEEQEGMLDSPTHDFVSDTYEGSKISEEEVKRGMKQLGMGDKADDDWEQELQQELQDYEVVAQDTGRQGDDPEWENEIQEMLNSTK
ncbi:synapse-associated protein 1-like isoform X2 [Ornithodoros turicata]|uniref:synapse-associated protein 1-like isoform X2 n=1 Tax=Ornithodoros turicata TaxID=34597 RepID=UPI0031386CC2